MLIDWCAVYLWGVSLLAVMGLSQQTTAPAWRLPAPFLLENAATLAPREAKTATEEKGQMENTEHCPETSELSFCCFFLALAQGRRKAPGISAATNE